MDEWSDAARQSLAARRPAALISVLAVEGSAPRGAGTRMLVTEDAVAGTIGGGALEMQAIRQGRAVLGRPVGTWRVQDYPLGPLLGQCCGGRVRLLVERLDEPAAEWIGKAGVLTTRFEANGLHRQLREDRVAVAALSARGPQPGPGDEIIERLGRRMLTVYLFGAGHVGRAVAGAVAPLPVQLAWFDSRQDEAGPGVAFVEQHRLADCLADATADAVVLIMTHDHALDYALTSAALRSNVCFVGVIGSATKRARFLSRLARDGVDAGRLTCPIGIEGIAGKDPAIIAVSVAAQLMQMYGTAA